MGARSCARDWRWLKRGSHVAAALCRYPWACLLQATSLDREDRAYETEVQPSSWAPHEHNRLLAPSVDGLIEGRLCQFEDLMNTCLRPGFLLSFAQGGRTFCHIQTNPLLRLLWRSEGTFNKISVILFINTDLQKRDSFLRYASQRITVPCL